MICPNCNQQIPDNSAFCSVCGANLSAAPAPQPQYAPIQQEQYVTAEQPQYAPTEQPQYAPVTTMPEQPAPKSNKKMLIIIGAVVAVAVILICFFTLGGNGDGPNHRSAEDIAMYAMEANYNCDAVKFLNCVPDFYVDYLMEEYDVYNRDDLIAAMQRNASKRDPDQVSFTTNGATYYKEGEGEYGRYYANVGVKFKPSSETHSQINEFADVECSVQYSGEDGYSFTEKIVCIKIGSNWYVIPDFY